MNAQTLGQTLEFLARVMMGSGIKLKRNKFDFFADRLRVAASQPTLMLAGQAFLAALKCPISDISQEVFAGFMTACLDADILAWLRQNCPVAVGLARAKDRTQGIEAVISTWTQQPAAVPVKKRRPFDIGMIVTLEEALSHADDTKAGNATLFRRNKMGYPFYSGNAIGGAMRDMLADHFLLSLGMRIDRADADVDQWFFQLLYGGGIMADGAIPKEFERRLCGAAAGSVRTDGTRELRNMLPFFSMMGGVGKYPIEGYVFINSLRPNCLEWGTGDQSVVNRMEWRFIARRDDSESRVSKSQAKEAKESKEARQDNLDEWLAGDIETDAEIESHENTSMLVNTEVLTEGTVLEGGIDVSPHMTEVERSALAKGLMLLQRQGYLGGKKHRGGGRAEIEYVCKPEIVLDETVYDAYLAEHKAEIIQYLKSIGANPRGV